jgi:tripartite-type tricarboxylate transporter receptor subunit TctC
MKIHRRQIFELAAGAAAAAALPQRAHALDYPTRPIHFIAGFTAGSGLDVIARLLGQAVTERLGQTVVVDNRPGAGTNIATEYVVNAPPDGYTILMASTANYTNGALYPNLGFDFVRDIAPVASVSRGGIAMLVNPAFAAQTIPDFIAYAKAHPGKIAVGSAGNGTVTHISGEMFKIMAGIDTVHVAYRGEPQVLTDVIGGQVECAFITIAGSAELVKAAKLRALGVTTAQRSELFPDVPAIGEFVPGYEANLWNGMGAPRQTPPEIIERLNAAINAGLNDPKIKQQFAAFGSVTAPLTPAEYGKVIVTETERWSKVIRAAGIKAE